MFLGVWEMHTSSKDLMKRPDNFQTSWCLSVLVNWARIFSRGNHHIPLTWTWSTLSDHSRALRSASLSALTFGRYSGTRDASWIIASTVAITWRGLVKRTTRQLRIRTLDRRLYSSACRYSINRLQPKRVRSKLRDKCCVQNFELRDKPILPCLKTKFGLFFPAFAQGNQTTKLADCFLDSWWKKTHYENENLDTFNPPKHLHTSSPNWSSHSSVW